jgi:hypothetical protein
MVAAGACTCRKRCILATMAGGHLRMARSQFSSSYFLHPTCTAHHHRSARPVSLHLKHSACCMHQATSLLRVHFS